MARKRTASISESLHFLRHLEQQHRGRPVEVRLRVLRLIKENPALSLGKIAEHATCSERSAQRWWSAYRTGGINAILNEDSERSGGARVGEKEIKELGQKLQTQELATLGDIQQWLKAEHNVEYTIPGVSQLVRRKLNVKRAWAPEHVTVWNGGVASISANSDAPTFSPRVLKFLNSLPLTGNLTDRLHGFRTALQHLFTDVDRININVNATFTLNDPYNATAGIIIRQLATVEPDWSQTFVVTNEAVGEDTAQRLLDEFRTKGLPIDDYHPPHYRDYRLANDVYLGTIFLWREKAKDPIAPRSVALLAAIEPFMYFLLFDLVAHHQVTKPVDMAFKDALIRLNEEAGLTLQERRIVLYQLLGSSYKEIADLLDISLSTLKSHITTIHQKTGTRSQGELFGKYFTPKLRGLLDTINNDLQ